MMDKALNWIQCVEWFILILITGIHYKSVTCQESVTISSKSSEIIQSSSKTLTCKYTLRNPTDPVNTLTWSFGENLANDVLIVRYVDVENTPRYENGYTEEDFIMTIDQIGNGQGSSNLTIPSLDFTKHIGRFWCEVLYIGYSPFSASVNVDVNVPARTNSVSVYIDGDKVTTSSITLPPKSEDYEALCEVKGVKPLPDIEWSGIEVTPGRTEDAENEENSLLWDRNSTVTFQITEIANLKVTVTVPGEGGRFEKMIELNVEAPREAANKPANNPSEKPGSNPDGHKPKMIAIGVGCGCGCIIILALVTLLVVRYRKGYSCWDSKPDDCEKTDSTQVPPNPKATPPKQETGQETEPTNRTDDQSRCLLPDGPPQKEEKKIQLCRR